MLLSQSNKLLLNPSITRDDTQPKLGTFKNTLETCKRRINGYFASNLQIPLKAPRIIHVVARWPEGVKYGSKCLEMRATLVHRKLAPQTIFMLRYLLFKDME